MRTVAMVLGLAGLLLGACSSSDAPVQDATPTTTQAGPGAEFTTGVPVGTNAAPAKLQFRLGAAPVVGHSVAVSVRVTPTAEVEKLQASFEVEPGLAFPDDAQTSFVTDRLAPGVAHPHELQVLPEQAGIHVLKVTVMTDIDGASKTSTFAIPLIVAAPAAPATGG